VFSLAAGRSFEPQKGAEGRFNSLKEAPHWCEDKNETVHRAPFLIIDKSDEVSEIFSI
jgi:hypothetical protein